MGGVVICNEMFKVVWERSIDGGWWMMDDKWWMMDAKVAMQWYTVDVWWNWLEALSYRFWGTNGRIKKRGSIGETKQWRNGFE